MLNDNPMHGYQLKNEMERHGYVREGRFKTGSLYTILNRMEEHGDLSSTQEQSEEGRTRRIYCVTDEGRSHLKAGLEYMLRRKRFLDKLEEYYKTHFLDDDA
jgi:DNA-binding PadR family transcriptional regulator